LAKKRDDSYFAVDRRRKRKYMMIIVPVIIAVAVAGAVGAIFNQPPAAAMPISGIECEGTERHEYHVHSHLDVFVDGTQREVPSNVGILSSPPCLYWLHTHSNDGLIHVEAPAPQEFMLGQFLDIWEQTHDDSAEFFDSISDKQVTAYVNGTAFEGDYRAIPLEDLKHIVLAYGTPLENIPEYSFGSMTR
jgi:hypothetical protein